MWSQRQAVGPWVDESDVGHLFLPRSRIGAEAVWVPSQPSRLPGQPVASFRSTESKRVQSGHRDPELFVLSNADQPLSGASLQCPKGTGIQPTA
jgi:hypothetical protein